MDWLGFILGALGATVTVYLAQQEVIPEFRAVFDTSDKTKEASEVQQHVEKKNKQIDDIQDNLRDPSVAPEVAERLTTVLNSCQREVEDETRRLTDLERDIKQGQIISRSFGFFFYIILGGAFGSLLAGIVQIQGFSGALPKFFESIIIGATWPTYLSVLGLQSGLGKANQEMDSIQKKASENLDSLTKEIPEIVRREVAKAEMTEKRKQPIRADEVAGIIADKLDLANMGMQNNFNQSRQLVQRYLKATL
jgi:hypothetical protein